MRKNMISTIIMALMAFIAGFVAFAILLSRIGHYPLWVAVIGGILGGGAVAYAEYYHLRQRANIKAIVQEYRLTSDDLARITGERSTDFPIYHGDLSLIVPKRRWGLIEKKLQTWAAENSRPNIKKK